MEINRKYIMALFHLTDIASALPHSWQSKIVARPGGCNIKIVRMDAQSYPNDTHDYDEALIVIDGKMILSVESERVEVAAGEMYLARAGVPHAVLEGSHGTLMIVDPARG